MTHNCFLMKVRKKSFKVQTFSIAKSCLMSREASSLENEFEKHFSYCICRVTFLMNENYHIKVSNNTFLSLFWLNKISSNKFGSKWRLMWKTSLVIRRSCTFLRFTLTCRLKCVLVKTCIRILLVCKIQWMVNYDGILKALFIL